MKSKYFLVKIFGLLFLILIIALFFLFYFLPTVEDISLHKRELSNMRVKIQDFLSNEKEFDFPTDREREFFQQAENDLKEKIAGVKSREEFITLFTEVFDYIKTRAARDGVHNLVANATSSDLELNATTLSNDKDTLERLLNFATLRLTEMQKKLETFRRPAHLMDAAGNPIAPPAEPKLLLPGLKYQRVYLSFTAELSSAMDFINHLPWCRHFVRLDNITVAAGSPHPYFWVFLKVYYIDHRSAVGG